MLRDANLQLAAATGGGVVAVVLAAMAVDAAGLQRDASFLAPLLVGVVLAAGILTAWR